MCLAQAELTRCDKKRNERGPGCEFHDLKVLAAGEQQDPPDQLVFYVRHRRRHSQESMPTSST
jgi:hypothetical protein